MLLCRVTGTVVSTAKSEGFRGAKLLLVQEHEPGGTPVGRVFVAVDCVGAGTGETVLVSQGTVARDAGIVGDAPTDAAVVAIVDAVENGNLSPAAKQRALEAARE